MSSHDGTLGIDEQGNVLIAFDRVLAHDVDRVWAALTDATKLEAWMPGSSIEARVGGRVRFDFGDEGAAHGFVTDLRAPGRDEPGSLTHTWEWEGVPSSEVTWTATPLPEGTRLQLQHRELREAGVTDFAIGWHFIIEMLDRHLGGRSSDAVWDDYDEVAAAYATQKEEL